MRQLTVRIILSLVGFPPVAVFVGSGSEDHGSSRPDSDKVRWAWAVACEAATQPGRECNVCTHAAFGTVTRLPHRRSGRTCRQTGGRASSDGAQRRHLDAACPPPRPARHGRMTMTALEWAAVAFLGFLWASHWDMTNVRGRLAKLERSVDTLTKLLIAAKGLPQGSEGHAGRQAVPLDTRPRRDLSNRGHCGLRAGAGHRDYRAGLLDPGRRDNHITRRSSAPTPRRTAWTSGAARPGARLGTRTERPVSFAGIATTGPVCFQAGFGGIDSNAHDPRPRAIPGMGVPFGSTGLGVGARYTAGARELGVGASVGFSFQATGSGHSFALDPAMGDLQLRNRSGISICPPPRRYLTQSSGMMASVASCLTASRQYIDSRAAWRPETSAFHRFRAMSPASRVPGGDR